MLLVPTPLVLALFCSSIPTSLFIFKMFFRSCKKKEEFQIGLFTSRGAYVNCAIIAMLYIHSIGNQL